jgi:hypothetical protein
VALRTNLNPVRMLFDFFLRERVRTENLVTQNANHFHEASSFNGSNGLFSSILYFMKAEGKQV